MSAGRPGGTLGVWAKSRTQPGLVFQVALNLQFRHDLLQQIHPGQQEGRDRPGLSSGLREGPGLPTTACVISLL